MNTIDIVLGVIFVIAFFMGFGKGLLRSLASLIGLVAGVYGAMLFSGHIEVYLEKWFTWSDDLNRIAAFMIMFLLIMLLFSLLGRVLTKVADFMMLGIFNKLLGGVFNALKFAFLLSVVFMFINTSEEYQILSQRDRDSSMLYHPVTLLAPAILPEIQKQVEELDIDFIKDEENRVKPNSPSYQPSDTISPSLP